MTLRPRAILINSSIAGESLAVVCQQQILGSNHSGNRFPHASNVVAVLEKLIIECTIVWGTYLEGSQAHFHVLWLLCDQHLARKAG